jgi:hypothetical protein
MIMMHAHPIHPYKAKQLPNGFGLRWLTSEAYIIRLSLYELPEFF